MPITEFQAIITLVFRVTWS